MARIDRLSYKEAAKARVSSRLKQLVVLFLTVVIGMLISVSVNAQSQTELPETISKQHSLIREMVSVHLKEENGNSPIELAPVYFTLTGGKCSIKDMTPLLIAVEFALQGKTIVINTAPAKDIDTGYDQYISFVQVQKLTELMKEMGVPEERISFAGYNQEIIASLANKSIEGSRRVYFSAF
jgi:hypothetical protein